MANEVRLIEFEVVDNQAGGYPDCEKIALTEDWAKRLIYCDIDCFALTEDGDLILIDDCNNIAYPPSDRFTVKFDPESLRPKGRWFEMIETKEDGYTGEYYEDVYYNCINCDYASDWNSPYCPNCGAKMEG